MNNYFPFNGSNYGKGAVVKIREKHKGQFNFYLCLIFEEYDENNDVYCFRTPYNHWERFNISANQLQEYIETVIESRSVIDESDDKSKTKQEYVNGIVDAWFWYIIIMLCGLFIQGVGNIIIVWIIASTVFFGWRHKKMNGE